MSKFKKEKQILDPKIQSWWKNSDFGVPKQFWRSVFFEMFVQKGDIWTKHVENRLEGVKCSPDLSYWAEWVVKYPP